MFRRVSSGNLLLKKENEDRGWTESKGTAQPRLVAQPGLQFIPSAPRDALRWVGRGFVLDRIFNIQSKPAPRLP
jgi:hypothetical protein